MKQLYRAMALASVSAILGSNMAFAADTTWPTQPFPDVSKTSAHYTAIEYLRQQKVLKGYTDGTFGPERRINRAEMVKLIANPFILDTERLNDCIPNNVSASGANIFFSDVRRDAWYGPELCLTHVKQIIDGYPDGTFGPGNNLNFVEAAKIIVSTFALQTSTDPNDQRWFIPYVNALAEHHAIPTSIKRFDQIMTRGEMAEIMYRLKADKENLASQTTANIR